MKYQVVVEGRTFEIEVGSTGQVWVNGRPLQVDLQELDRFICSLLVDHRSFEAAVEAIGDECQVVVTGRPYRASLQCGHSVTQEASLGTSQKAAFGCGEVTAPLPGLLVELRVREGQWVEAGTVVAVMDSMKMHLELRAPCDGVVCSLPISAGQELMQGDVVAVIGEPSD